MRQLLAVSAFLAIAACSSTTAVVKPSPSPSVNRSPSSDAVPMAGGCGTTQVYKGGEPDWLSEAAGGLNGLDELPYFITDPASAAGFIFGYPLHAKVTPGQGNKILWVVGVPRNEADLHISGHPLGAGTPTVQLALPPNSSPGEIYPSEVDVPQAGCWHFDLTWGKSKTSVDLVYG